MCLGMGMSNVLKTVLFIYCQCLFINISPCYLIYNTICIISVSRTLEDWAPESNSTIIIINLHISIEVNKNPKVMVKLTLHRVKNVIVGLLMFTNTKVWRNLCKISSITIFLVVEKNITTNPCDINKVKRLQ